MVYTFNQNAFNQRFITRMEIIFLVLAAAINIVLLLSKKWSVEMSVILIVFVWLPIVGACVQQNKVWKQSYIETSESEIRYYRVIRDGYEDGSTSYIYEGILMTVNTVTSVSVKGNYIYITGDIRKDVFKDREHSKVQSCNLQSIKIPLYFGEQDALINALLGYQ